MDLVTFNEEILSENLYSLCSVCKKREGSSQMFVRILNTPVVNITWTGKR